MTADEIRKHLQLEPLPDEGGYFRETYRSTAWIPKDPKNPVQRDRRSLSTAIYYFLTPDTFSAMHRLPGDEVFHFYLGDPVEMLLLSEDGTSRIAKLGNQLGRGMEPQVVVPGGTWQGSRLVPDGRFALLGTTMAPGFDFSDFEPGDRHDLARRYPDTAEMITELTRSA